MLQSYFVIPGGFTKSQQNWNHSLPLLLLNTGFDDAAKLLLHMCDALLAYHKLNGGNFFFIKESSFNRQRKLFFSFLTETFLCNYFLFKYNIFAMPFFYFNVIFF